MVEKKVSETTQKLNQLWYESGQAVVQSSFDIQDRTFQCTQDSLKDGLETLKSHIEDAQRWLQMGNKSLDQQEAFPSFVENGIEAYKRNVALVQRITELEAETLRSNAEVVHDLTQTLLKKAQEQQEWLLMTIPGHE